jgi:hypothetical protein
MNDSATNLQRWKAGGEPVKWLLEHRHWSHNRDDDKDGRELLSGLRKSQYWPMHGPAVLEHLKVLTTELDETRLRQDI